MNQNNLHPAWMDDETVKNIPQEKLDFLSQLFINGKGKNQKEMMAFILPMLKKAKAENLSFSQSEITTCIQAIKKYSTEEEQAGINKILSQHNINNTS